MLAHILKVRHQLVAVCLALFVAAPAWAQSIDEQPNPVAMVGDLVVARPIGLVMTAVGGAAFVISLPLTAMAGSVSESAELMVLGPAKTTFVRCLGCRVSGYSYKDVERRRERDRKHAEEEAQALAEGE